MAELNFPPHPSHSPYSSHSFPVVATALCRRVIRFLLASGNPLKEPVGWNGPIVMNTQEQLRHAFEELKEGTFLESNKTH
jgi:hypothetical protein